MLARTADNMYWLARYVERAEYLARILEATQRLTAMPLSYVGGTNEWQSAIATAGSARAFAAQYPEANEESAIDFLAFVTTGFCPVIVARSSRAASRRAISTGWKRTCRSPW